jgi:polar amino acid transport system substrate-binding protein
MKEYQLLAALALTSHLALAGVSEKIVICSGEWAPFMSEKSAEFGYSSHIVTQAFKLVNVDVEYMFLPWKRTIIRAKAGEQCVGAIGYIWTENRNKDFYYSAPILNQPKVLFYLKDQPINFDGSLKSLKGHTIGGIAGSSNKLMDAAKKAGLIEFEISGNIATNFQKLLRKRFSAIPIAKEVGKHYIRNNLTLAQKRLITYSSIPLVQWDSHVIFSRNSVDSVRLVQRFNRGLRELKAKQINLSMQKDLMKGFYD